VKIFLAGMNGTKYLVENLREPVPYVLESYWYMTDFMLNAYNKGLFKEFLLDSGAFTLLEHTTSAPKDILDDYVTRYACFIDENEIDNFFEMDIDGIVGYKEVLRYRKLIEDITKKPVIPAWHKSRGEDEFIKMCKDYDHVSIGGIVARTEIKPKEYEYLHWFIEKAHKYGAEIHGLGFTPIKILKEFNFDSVDSISWLAGGYGGYVFQFDGTNIKTERSAEKGGRRINHRIVNAHNFVQWRRYQDYMSEVSYVHN